MKNAKIPSMLKTPEIYGNAQFNQVKLMKQRLQKLLGHWMSIIYGDFQKKISLVTLLCVVTSILGVFSLSEMAINN